MGMRRILSLIKGLPPRSAISRTYTQGRDWGTTDELLAALIEQTDFTNRILYSANTKKGVQVWKPIKINRPTDEEKKPRLSSPSAIRKFFKGSAKFVRGDG